MNNGRFRGWMRRRIARRVQKKLGLSTEQTTELMPILGKLRRPHHLCNDAERSEIEQVLSSETFDTEQLNTLVFEKLNRYKQTLDEQALALIYFVSEMDLTQRENLHKMISKHHHCGRRMCRS